MKKNNKIRKIIDERITSRGINMSRECKHVSTIRENINDEKKVNLKRIVFTSIIYGLFSHRSKVYCDPYLARTIITQYIHSGKQIYTIILEIFNLVMNLYS